MKFYEKLINLRKEKGLSQEEFGNIFNVSRQSVSKWELGKVKPDIDKVKKICEFYNVSFDYLLNDEIEEKNSNYNENDLDNIEENNEEQKNEGNTKKNRIPMAITIILFILVILYVFCCLFKAIVFSNILSKNDMDDIESYKYSSSVEKEYVYNGMKDDYVYDTTVNEYICYKDNMYYVWISYEDDEDNCMYWEQYWDYYNKKFEHKGYNLNAKVKDAIWTYEYYYRDDGNFLRQFPTFKFINTELKDEFCISNILNPFKIYKITDDGNIVIDRYSDENVKYSKHIYYIDIKSGFLSKEEIMQNDEIVEKKIYEGYEINCVEAKDFMFDKNIKQDIIEKSVITEQENIRKAKEKYGEEIIENI